MGKKDIALDAYFSSAEIFADLFNAWLYRGQQVIRPELLQKQSPVQAVPEYAAQYRHRRDMVHMLYEGEAAFLLLALENQEEEEWKKTGSLHDMLLFTEKSEVLRPLVSDYPIHVLSVRRELDPGLLHTELKQVIGFLQHQDEGEGLKRYV